MPESVKAPLITSYANSGYVVNSTWESTVVGMWGKERLGKYSLSLCPQDSSDFMGENKINQHNAEVIKTFVKSHQQL